MLIKSAWGIIKTDLARFWNKTVTAMRLFKNDKLYVSTGLNYEFGGQIWLTER